MQLHRCLSSIVVILSVATAMSGNAQQSANSDWKPVEDALGRKGSMQPGDVYKFSMPRSDLKVTVAGSGHTDQGRSCTRFVLGVQTHG